MNLKCNHLVFVFSDRLLCRPIAAQPGEGITTPGGSRKVLYFIFNKIIYISN